MQNLFTPAGQRPALVLLALTCVPAVAKADTALPVTIYATQAQYGIPINEIGTSVSVLTAADIQRSGASTLADVLRRVPGVAVSPSGGIGSFTQVRVRGGEANHLLLIVDGVRYNDPSGIGFDFSGLLAGDIERIEVIRGPQSGIYGTDAHAGVITVTTRSAKDARGPQARVQVEAGSFDTLAGSAFVGGGNGKVWGSASATGISTSGYNFATTGSEQDGADIGTLVLRLGAAPAPGLTLDNVVRLGRRIAEFDDTNDTEPTLPALVDRANVRYRQNDIAGRFSATYQPPGTPLTQFLSYDYYEFDREARDKFGMFDSDGSRQAVTYRSSAQFAVPDIAQSRHDVSVQLSHEVLDYETSFQPLNTLSTTGIAAEWRASFWDQLFLSAAARYDTSERFADATTYRLTGRYNLPGTGFSLHAAAGTGVTNPTLDELFGSGSGFVGNPSLKPENSFEWEAGFNQGLFDGKLDVGVTYFNARTTNEIRTVFFPTYTALNDAGASPRDGVEVTATATPWSGFSLSSSYTYTHARTAADLEEVRRPPHSGSVNATWFLFENQATLNIGASFNGPAFDDDFRAFPSSRVKLSGSTLVNAQFAYKLNPHAEAYVRVQNALDDDYEEQFGVRGAPFMAYAGVKIKLDN